MARRIARPKKAAYLVREIGWLLLLQDDPGIAQLLGFVPACPAVFWQAVRKHATIPITMANRGITLLLVASDGEAYAPGRPRGL